MPYFRRHALTATLLLAAGCSSSKTAPEVTTGSLIVTAAPGAALADGGSVVAVSVSGTATAPIRVTTTKGTFTGGVSSVVVSSLPASLTLYSCDAAANAACAGTAVIQAVDATLTTGAASVTFTAVPGSSTGGGGSDNSGTSGAITITAVASAARIPADGEAKAAVTATVLDSSKNPVSGRTVNFVQTGSAAVLKATSAVTDASGLATVGLVSSKLSGTAKVTVTDAVSGASSTVTIDMPQLGQVNLLSQQYQVQGVRYSGYQETNTLTFQLLDTAGQPYPAELAVDFKHQSLTGSFIGAVADCTTATPSICSAQGKTDASGRVTIPLSSGRTAGVVSVTASGCAGFDPCSVAVTGTASNLAFVGAKASGAHISVDCSPKNIPALMNHDCSNSFYAGPGSTITCKAFFADRFNNVLGIATQATFASEAGSAGPPASTPQYDPAQAPTAQTSLGIATDFVNVTGYPVPKDVTPFAGEYWAQYTDACGTLKHNPRDGLVTIIAAANGEEGFVDTNGNGVYDANEPFIDMGEPFVDANDNGRYDAGEYFIDLNQDGIYNGPNGVWDGPGCQGTGCKQSTVIWAETHVLYTGLPMFFADNLVNADGVDQGQNWFTRFYTGGTLPAPPWPTSKILAGTLPGNPDVRGSTTGPLTKYYSLFFTDQHFNPITPMATYSIAPAGTLISTKFPFTPTPVDNLGMNFTQQYCDRAPPATGTYSCSNTCSTAPCYVVTNVGTCDLPNRIGCNGFGYGNGAQAAVTGSCSAAGTDSALVTVTVNGVASIFGQQVSCVP